MSTIDIRRYEPTIEISRRTINIDVNRSGVPGAGASVLTPLVEAAELAAALAAASAASASASVIAMQLAVAGSAPYADVAAGLAGTSVGDTFWVDNGDGTATIYVHETGPVATEISTFIMNIKAGPSATLVGGNILNVATLIASTSLFDGFVPEGTSIRTREEGYSYVVASPSASDYHLTTAGGLKLYVLPNPDGSWSAAAFGVSPDVTDNVTYFESMRDALIARDRTAHYTIKWPVGVLKTSRNRLFDGLLRYTLEASGSILQNTSISDQLSAFMPIGPREGIFRVSGRAETGILYFTGHRFDSADAGDNSITMTTSGEAALYDAGDNVLLMGFATQRVGYSPNFRFFEYKRVSSVVGDVITFDHDLTESYDEDWPDFNYSDGGTSGSITLGTQYVGKPRIINLSGRAQGDGTEYWWPEFVHIKDLRLRKNPTAVTTNRLAIPGRHVILENTGWEDGSTDTSIDARENELAEWIGVLCPEGGEPDKLVGNMIIRGGSFGNNPDNGYALLAGVGIKNILMDGARVGGRISLNPRDGLIINGGRYSSVHRSNVPTQGPFMPAFFGGSNLIVNGPTIAKLSDQSIYATTTTRLTNTYTITNVDAVNGEVDIPWTATTNPDNFLRFFTPGKTVWLASDPRIRGKIENMVDSGSGYVSLSFSSGNLGPSIQAGLVVVGSVLEFYFVDNVVINGKPLYSMTTLQNPPVGQLRWEEMTYDSPWVINGVQLTDTGMGTASDTVDIPCDMIAGNSYMLVYDMTRVSGSVLIRASGEGTNLASLNATATNTAIQLDVLSTSDTIASLQIKSSAFSGSFTPRSITPYTP